MIGVHWMGDIAADATVYIEITGLATPATTFAVRGGGSISYKLYDENFPFVADWPATTCA